MKHTSNNTNQTLSIAKDFAKTLNAGDIVLLNGDLGAGKTVFTKGIVDYFSNGQQVAVSPTVTIVNQYNCNPPIYHFDFYRIKSEDELFAIGIEEYLYGGGICIIEWPERAPQLLSQLNCKTVTITKNDNKRTIEY